MKIIGYLLLLCLFIALIGQIKITASPFSISLPGWRNVMGSLFFLVAMFFFSRQSYVDGYKKAIQDYREETAKITQEHGGDLRP